MQSVMGHRFSAVPNIGNIPRSMFNRSHGLKTTFSSGYLVPIYVDEALPGDTFNLRLNALARLATPIYPIMDNMFLETFFFAVPVRLLWSNFKKMMGEQVNPGDSTSYLVPRITTHTGILESTLFDYMGIPTKIANLPFDNLHGRAYNLIWNEWFRDQNLQDSLMVDLDDGPDTIGNYVLQKRGKRHDYFTSCLPWPQKGTAVTIPIGTSAPIVGSGNLSIAKMDTQIREGASGGGTDRTSALAMRGGPPGSNDVYINATTGGVPMYLHHPAHSVPFANIAAGLTANLSAAAAATVNALRESFQVQKMYERDARSGTRYIEVVKAHFGVDSPDERMQRPEYLGGGSSMVNIHPIAQQSGTGASGTTSPLGSLAGFGLATVSGHGFTKSFTEHCVLLGLANVRADIAYQQGLDRMFSRRTRLDFYWPALAQLGEQAVLNKEIYADNSANDDLVFGYQERYAEYRYKPSRVTGLFRSNATGTLHAWHLSQQFGSLPVLNSSFIVDAPPVSRVIAVPSEPEFIFDSFFDLKCARAMPVYGVPGMMDHF